MEKKATLVIKNLEHVYTMQELEGKPVIFQNAFIAIHHECIMEIGKGDFLHLCDKDTRVIDGRGHCALPAFIECKANVPCGMNRGEQLRIYNEILMKYMRHGTLTIQMPAAFESIDCVFNYHYDTVYEHEVHNKYPVLTMRDVVSSHKPEGEAFCISAYDAQYRSSNPLLVAQFMAMRFAYPVLQLLKALTIYPAMHLNLTRVGSLASGMQADIIIMNAHNLEDVFHNLEPDKVTQIIKKGVRIYPNVLI